VRAGEADPAEGVARSGGAVLDGITLYFVRHGETDWNADRRLQGVTDVPLNATGRAQAQRNAERLAETEPDWSRFAIAVSPLSRARQTYRIIAEHLGLPREPACDERLLEGSFGRWEGKSWNELVAEEPEAHALFVGDPWANAPHGGETYGDLAVRVADWAAGLTQDTLVVSHGGVSRVLRKLYLDLAPSELLGLPVRQDRILRFRGGAVEIL